LKAKEHFEHELMGKNNEVVRLERALIETQLVNDPMDE